MHNIKQIIKSEFTLQLLYALQQHVSALYGHLQTDKNT
jgi:hypothetical protein